MPRSSVKNRLTQTARIVTLLRSRSPEWVPLPEILNLRISQYSARIHQARHQWGLPVENKTEVVGGKRHSWFRLIENTQAYPIVGGNGSSSPAGSGSVFGELASESRYPD